jgi:hypothetical protein
MAAVFPARWGGTCACGHTWAAGETIGYPPGRGRQLQCSDCLTAKPPHRRLPPAHGGEHAAGPVPRTLRRMSKHHPRWGLLRLRARYEGNAGRGLPRLLHVAAHHPADRPVPADTKAYRRP